MFFKTIKIAFWGVLLSSISGFQVSAVSLSPSMAEQLRNLPVAEQQRLAQQYGVTLPTNSTIGNIDSEASSEPIVIQRDERQKKAFDKNSPSDIAGNELTLFGYDLFEGEPTTFAPVGDIPVPSEYLVGPGDHVRVQLYGKQAQEYDLSIDRRGMIFLPQLGPISVSGLTFSELRATLTDHIQQKMIGVHSNITMGELRSIRIFVAGDAYKPGSYTVSSLSTITHALFVSGGVNRIGSLRSVQLKRNGKLVGEMDLYDLLMKGDSSGDVRLRSGDVVFIPSAGSRVSISGEVRRPAIYELRNNETVSDVIEMAGGMEPGAYPKQSLLERYSTTGLKSVLNIDLTQNSGKDVRVNAGDQIQVRSATEQFDNSITIVGAVVRPGIYQWRKGIRVNELLPSVRGDLLSIADLDYGLIVREIDEQGTVDTIQFSPRKALANDAKQNIELNARDKIIIFNNGGEGQSRFELNLYVKQKIELTNSLFKNSYTSGDLFAVGFDELERFGSRQRLSKRNSLAGVVISEVDNQEGEANIQAASKEVRKMMANLFSDPILIRLSYTLSRKELLFPIISKLIQQDHTGLGASIVGINGQVKYPGAYPLARDARVSDLVYAAGGLKEGAYTVRAELTRTITTELNSTVAHINVALGSALKELRSENKPLEKRDVLSVMTVPDWQEQKSVEIRGEVKFPGVYNISRGETMANVISRAGGFTEYAFLPSAVFVRESIRKQEQLEVKKLANQLRRDIATRGVSKDGSVVNYSDAQLMLSDLEKIKAVGRLVVDVQAVSNGIEQADIQMEDNDVLYIPSTQQTIAVVGEVQNAATHRYKKGLNIEQYITMSGGTRKRADTERMYVIKADGSVILPSRSYWFGNDEQLLPGDTLVVPLDTEYKDSLSLWNQVTGIIYNTAVAVAAIGNL